MISKKQFNILALLTENRTKISQRLIAAMTKMSLGAVNQTIRELTDMGYINNGLITSNGLEALEPYRVERAIFIAAGFGWRLAPITLNIPKPLIRVKGVRIIDSLLDAVIAAGIKEIYIVRGYLSELFDQLLDKYPMIKFIENPYYIEANNISSIVCAGNLLSNSYVLEADLLLYNSKLITKYQYESNYLGVYTDKTDDWCLYTDNGVVKKMSVGGENCYRMFGISYWTKEDGEKLANHINHLYHSPGGKDLYWDQVALEYFIDQYNVYVRECTFDDIIEIDTFDELKSLDKAYDVFPVTQTPNSHR